MSTPTARRVRRAAALWLVAFALVVRALIPAGTMPVASGDGIARIALCDGTGAMAAKAAKSPMRDHHKPAGECPFATLAAAALTADPIAPVIVAAKADPAPRAPNARRFAFAYPERARPPPRAPPAVVVLPFA